MDLQVFLMSILEGFIASIPGFITVYVINKLKLDDITSQVGLFSGNLLTTKDDITDKIETKISHVLDNVDKRFEETIDKTNNIVEKVDNTIDKFDDRLRVVEDVFDHLFKMNMVNWEVLSQLVAKDANLIQEGTATILVNKIAMAKDEAMDYQQNVSKDYKTFEQAIKEQYAILGKDKFEEVLLKAIGDIYDDKEEE